jgi:molybdopterin converting factor small subunit
VAKIYLPTLMRKFVNSQPSVTVEGGTVSDVLSMLVSNYPDLRSHLYDDEGGLRRHIIIVLNGNDIRTLDAGLQAFVDKRDELRILPAMAGG